MFYHSNFHGAFVKVKQQNPVTRLTAGATEAVGEDGRAGPFCIRISFVVDNADEALKGITNAGGKAWA
jgi:hypothetical protein